MNLNTVIIAGNLTRDPEIRGTSSGKTLANLSLAINEGYGDKQRTIYIDVTAWDKTAEMCRNYLSKGRSILVEGRLDQDSWQDKETGQKRSKVTANRIHFADSKGGQGQSATQEPEQRRTAAPEPRAELTPEAEAEDDTLPF